MKNNGLTSAELESIKEIFAQYPQIESVTLYGSRALGNYKPASDIDLTLKGVNINISVLTNIMFELDDLMLPYKFDLTLFNSIINQDLINHIQKFGIQVYQRNQPVKSEI